MTIYLYVKTHNVTGLKYLGKTSSNDPHLYPGSGIRWRHHLNKHGYNYTTEILKECQTTDEIRHWGLYYSDLYNVVESKEWANLKPEIGDGGGTLGEYNPNKQNTPESIAKQLETKKKNGTLMTVNEESLTKGWETRRKNGNNKLSQQTIDKISNALIGHTRSQESIDKQRSTMIEKKTSPFFMEWTCEYCGKIGRSKGNYTRSHGVNCKKYYCSEQK